MRAHPAKSERWTVLVAVQKWRYDEGGIMGNGWQVIRLAALIVLAGATVLKTLAGKESLSAFPTFVDVTKPP